MDLESLLVSLFVLVDDWWGEKYQPAPRKPGRPPSLSHSEVLTLAILSQWPRWRSERDFHRYADTHLRTYFPKLLSHGQLNRRIRTLEPELRVLQKDLAGELSDPSCVYHVLDTTLIPAIVRVRACRKGLFAGQATFGRCASKTEWIYGFKVALSVSPEGVIFAFGLAEASSDERPIGEFLVSADAHDAYLADKGFSSVKWERHWLETHEALVAATPQRSAWRAWCEEACRWAAGKRQLIEGVIWQLKDYFGLERHRAKSLSGLLTRLAAKVAAYTAGQVLNERLGRPLRGFADLLI
ncbi:MAG: IS982 family transposase [Rubrobacter sp.]